MMSKLIITGFGILFIFCVPVAIFSGSETILPNLISAFVGYFCSILIFFKTKTVLSMEGTYEKLTTRIVFSNLLTFIIYVLMLLVLYKLFEMSVIFVVLGVLAYKLSLIITVIKGGVSIE